AQVLEGVVIDMSGLNRIVSMSRQSILCEAGCTWAQVVERTAPEGLSPPVLPDFVQLSVGGTLSVGGIGGASFRWGAQTDHVLALDVVTADAELVRCSPQQNPDLFDA